MKPINNWENVKAAGSIETLPSGAYVCEIKQAVEKPNKGAGTHLEISFEVIEGEYKGFFGRDYRSQEREDKFWRGIIRQNYPDENSPKYETHCRFFRSFTDRVEESNPGYHWDFNEAGLKGKKIGVTFGEKEKMSQRGNVYTITEAREIVSVEAVRSSRFRMPEKKMLTATSNIGGFAPTPVDDGSDLPF